MFRVLFLFVFVIGPAQQQHYKKDSQDKRGKTINKNHVFPGFWDIWGDRFARIAGKQSTRKKKKSSSFPSFSFLRSLSLSIFLFFSLFFLFLLLLRRFLFVFLCYFSFLAFFCCFDETEVGRKKKRPKQRKRQKRKHVDLNPLTGRSLES